jgi:hypothetical protein
VVHAQGGRVEVANGEPLGGGRIQLWLPAPNPDPELAQSHRPLMGRGV